MDLLLGFLRLLLGLPTESSELQPVALRRDGQTSGVRRQVVDDSWGRYDTGWEKLRQLIKFPDSDNEPAIWQQLSCMLTVERRECSRDPRAGRSFRD